MERALTTKQQPTAEPVLTSPLLCTLCSAPWQDPGAPDDSMIRKLFGVGLHTRLVCDETGEAIEVARKTKKRPAQLAWGPAVLVQVASLYTEFLWGTACVAAAWVMACSWHPLTAGQVAPQNLPSPPTDCNTLHAVAGGQHALHAQVQHLH